MKKNKILIIVTILIILFAVSFFILNNDECKEGSTSCLAGNVITCADGKIRLLEECDSGCEDSACIIPPACQQCKENSEWGECSFGKQKRTIYTCSRLTNFVCIESYDIKNCGCIQSKVLIIPVTTSDVPIPEYATKEWINNWILGDDGYSMKDYFEQNSYGKYSISGEVADWIVLENDSNYYKNNFENSQDRYMALNALKILDEEMDLSNFDSDNTGNIDTVIFFFPNSMIELLLGVDKHFDYAVGNFFKVHYGMVDGKYVISHLIAELPSEYPQIGRFDKVRFGQLVHEFSHIAPIRYYGKEYIGELGIGDLYNYPNEMIDRYGIMDGGANNDEGPSHFSGYSKMMIGWIYPEEVSFGQNKTIRLYKTEENSYTLNTKLVKIPRNQNNEYIYYLLEWRYLEEFENGHNFDNALIRALKTQGLLIYTINVTAYPDWLGRSPNLVKIIPADYINGDEICQLCQSAFGEETGIYKFESEEGINIKITNIAEDNTYADIEITYN